MPPGIVHLAILAVTPRGRHGAPHDKPPQTRSRSCDRCCCDVINSVFSGPLSKAMVGVYLDKKAVSPAAKKNFAAGIADLLVR